MSQNLRRRLLDLSRRQFLQAGGAGAMALTASALPTIARASADELLIASGGGDFLTALQKAYYDDFTKRTGIKVNPQPYKGLAELKLMVDSKAWGQADLMLMSSGEAASAQAAGLSEPIDYGLVNRDDLLPGTTGDNWFLVNVAASVLAWNTQAVANGSESNSWVDFFSASKKQPRGLWKSASLTLDIAALGAGVPIDKLYPLDIERALQTLSGIREHIVWWSGGSESQQLLVNNEVDESMMWVNRVETIRAAGESVNYKFNQAILDGDTLVIPKGHPKKAAAMKFAAYIASPAPQARLTPLLPLGPSNKKATALIKPEDLAKTAVDPKNLPLTRFQDFAWWAENSEKAVDSFNKWLLG